MSLSELASAPPDIMRIHAGIHAFDTITPVAAVGMAIITWVGTEVTIGVTGTLIGGTTTAGVTIAGTMAIAGTVSRQLSQKSKQGLGAIAEAFVVHGEYTELEHRDCTLLEQIYKFANYASHASSNSCVHAGFTSSGSFCLPWPSRP